ncbi:unnamed protein product [Owenia fusiformis]|uniref:Uncharacterized protein n=1 Tax=Owenia fusiformis TaxID=6347 RepID=A0A8J1UCD3_OWEFU|nr:unnamed protein product [Owenia fusiformis]
MEFPMKVFILLIAGYSSVTEIIAFNFSKQDQRTKTAPFSDTELTSVATLAVPTVSLYENNVTTERNPPGGVNVNPSMLNTTVLNVTKIMNETDAVDINVQTTQEEFAVAIEITSPIVHNLVTSWTENNRNVTETADLYTTRGVDTRTSTMNKPIMSTDTVDVNKVQLSPCLLRHMRTKTLFCCPPYNKDLNLDSLRPKGLTMASMAIEFWLSIVLCAGGLIGNILAFIILSKDNTNTSIFILKSLALVDGTYCLWYLMFDPFLTAYQNTTWVQHRDTKIVHWIALNKQYLGFVNKTLQLLSSWLVVLLTLDRYIVVCKPFKASSLCTLTKARVEVVCISICCICYNIPTCFHQESYMSVNPCTGAPVGMRKLTPFGNSYGYGIVYGMICEGLIKYIIPVVSVLAMNGLLVSALRKAARRRKALVTSTEKDSQKGRDNLTLMLTVVAFMFLLLILPAMGVKIVQILYYFHRSEKIVLNVDILKFSYGLAYCVLIISDLFLRINSSINFIIYTLVSARFRRGLYELVCCKKMADRIQDSAITNENAVSNNRSTAKTQV